VVALACAVLLAVPSTGALAQSSTVKKGSKSAAQPKAKPNAAGQAGRAKAPKAIVKAKHGDWQIGCEQLEVPEATAKLAEKQRGVKLPPAKDGVVTIERCAAVQTAVAEKAKNVGVTAIIVRGDNKGKKVSVFRVLAPIGVFLPTGVALEVDGKAASRIPFARCLPGGCLAFVGLTDTLLAKLKKGTKANLIIYQGPGSGIGVPLSLNGFTKAHDSL